MKKVCLVRVDSVCSRRTMDYLDIVRYAKANGFIVLPKNQIREAEYGCLVTCGSTDSSNMDSLIELANLRRYIPEERIVVLGCLPKTRAGFEENFRGKAVAPVDYQMGIDNAFIEIGIVSNLHTPYGKLDRSTEGLFEHIPYFSPEHWFLVTSEGCRGACKYCRIKTAIGSLKSMPPDDIIKSFTDGMNKGYQLFWPSGDDLGAYGLDNDNGWTFPMLMKKLIAIGDERGVSVKFDCRTVLDPQYLVRYEKDFLELLDRNPKNFISLGVGLQSSVSRLLQLSNRRHEANAVAKVVAKFKEVDQDLFMPAHLIIGLPTETVDETKHNFEFVSNSPIDLWVCSKYSHLKGTGFYREFGKELAYDPAVNYAEFKWLVQNSELLYHEVSLDGPLYVARKANPKFITLALKSGISA